MYVEKKSELLAAILSALFPGVGQIYNGRIMRGLVFIVLGGIFAALMVVIIGFILYPLFWIYNVLDAYKTAKLINAQAMETMQRVQTNQGAVKETTIIKEREIVKIPCPYCNQLVDVTADKCPNCGAKTTR